MIDRLVHHAEVISLGGDSYRLRNRDLGRAPRSHHRGTMTTEGVRFHLPPGGRVHFRRPLTPDCSGARLGHTWGMDWRTTAVKNGLLRTAGIPG